eukprot:6464455-Amphidinium_carterae.1
MSSTTICAAFASTMVAWIGTAWKWCVNSEMAKCLAKPHPVSVLVQRRACPKEEASLPKRWRECRPDASHEYLGAQQQWWRAGEHRKGDAAEARACFWRP